ncbi:SAM dependent carboxyl methyltransferase [Cynara cardunculus var. scolymus]|uniref:SAM dependent carboxyl methyltransferase n=1 Tax=Cynara cardunculus var. scolymus TaxID=59895 RepID=A0A103XWX7_CYNCS|nr:SAM dependent carboxyl methyltransferase [Cynara cardunculus var. scolymus]
MQVIHMNKGEGETIGISMVDAAITNILWEIQPTSMGVADLGCSSGPNSLTVISQIIHVVDTVSHQMGRPVPELRVFLNDLLDNDFNSVFQSLPQLYKQLSNDCSGINEGNCYICGSPGSFYGRLFPSQSLHFVHSSSSLHWLSQVPSGLEATHLNKEKLYISKSSPASVVEAYQQQFQKDFSLFLRSRAHEMVVKGRMVLSFLGRRSPDPSVDEACYHWELLARALMSLALDGLVEKESIDSFNAPYYAPSQEEVEHEVEKEGSFVIHSVEAFEIAWDDGDSSGLKESSGTRVAKTIRAVVELMIENHFHLHAETMDVLFRRYAKIVDDCFSETRLHYTNLLIYLVKKG